jgi:hypothetical protein
MDFGSFDDLTNTIEIKVNGEPTGLKITVLSKESDAVKSAQRSILNQRMKMKEKDVDAETVEKQNRKLLAAGVVGWEWGGDSNYKGEKLEFTPENLTNVLKVGLIKDQVDDAIGDIGGFFAG